MTGAVDFDQCTRRYRRGCYCGRCAVCGFPMHSAVHGPVLGQPPGSKPFGHEFVPIVDEPVTGSTVRDGAP